MRLINADNFKVVKSKYIDVIENTPDIGKHAHWIYGKHPTDESLKAYIDRGRCSGADDQKGKRSLP